MRALANGCCCDMPALTQHQELADRAAARSSISGIVEFTVG
jgi:hypothetical protein